jgi:hypothetical protein
MKTFTILILSLCWLGANATIWRINSNPQVSADFVSINDAIAHWDVLDGDTLYLENGSYFGGATISKSLTIIGPGYFLMENDSTYVNPFPVLIGQVVINTGGSGSKIVGITVIGEFHFHTGANNITIERSKMAGVRTSGSSSQISSGLIVRQCYITGSIYDGTSSNSYFLSSTIHNNIIIGTVSLSHHNANHNIYNNVIWFNSTTTNYALAARNSSVLNNIIIREPYDENPAINRAEYCIDFSSGNNSNSTFARNVTTQSPNASFPDNIWNVEKEDVFVLEGSTDKRWILKEGSPAIGYGSNGDDCGAYGGAMYYVLSGLPSLLPRIFEATIPASGSGNAIPVYIKAKTQEE